MMQTKWIGRTHCFLVVVFALLFPQTTRAETTNTYISAGTQRMKERLENIYRKANPANHPFLNHARAEMYRRMLQPLTNSPLTRTEAEKKVSFQHKYAIELLNSGDNETAIKELTRLEQLLKESRLNNGQNRTLVRDNLAIAYLRIGERENCLSNHTIDSCLLPIAGRGVHTLPRGSRAAIQVLTKQLEEFSDDLRARWLLNIAYMTLGEYPKQVPPAWLIPPKAFESDYDINRFPDVAGKIGLDLDTMAGGVIMDDFDGDGNLDLMISAWGVHDQIRYFHNNADGSFTERTKEAGLTGVLGGLNLIQADYNNDGHVDFLLLRGAWLGTEGRQPNSLLRNNGNGTFDDVTEEAGLLSFHPTQGATWFDFNNDGWIDLFVGNESTSTDPHPCELYRNNGDGTFTECAAGCGVAAMAFVKAVASGDFNNDGWPDLYLSCRGEPNILFRNDGPQGSDKSPKGAWRFTNVAAAAGVTEPIHSFPTWFWDYDNDGWLDIFVSGYKIENVRDVAADYLGLPTNAERPRLYHNNHDGTFSDVTRSTHLWKILHAMAGNFGDLDNDGWLDFYLGTGDPNLSTLIPNRMFRNAEGTFFQDVTTSGGFGHLQKGHGIAFGDIDNDGDQDIYEVMGGANEGDNFYNVLFENPAQGNHWITLKLEGVQSNRSAIGARIKVTTNTKQGSRNIYKTVSSGGSFGASPLRQEIGLGQTESIEAVEVTWPVTGKTQVLKGLALDRFYFVRESENSLAVKLKTFKLGTGELNVHQHVHH